jgi:protein tyrosine phosphatase
MLASEIETGRVKCAKYWPDQAQSKEYSLRSDTQDDIPLTVTTTSQNFEPSSKEEIVIREIEIKTGEERHQVTMIQVRRIIFY